MTALSPTAIPGRGPVHLFTQQVLFELRGLWRTPEALIGLGLLPLILFTFFGVSDLHKTLSSGAEVGPLIFVGFSCYGIVSAVLYGVCAQMSAERMWPWMRRMRATALPGWAYLGAKLVATLVMNLLSIAGPLVLTLASGVDFPAGRLAATLVMLVVGSLLLAPLGMALGYLVRPRAASAIANVAFLPLSFCSGFFVPLAKAPGIVRDIAPYLPTYHFGQLVWHVAASPADVAEYTHGAGSGLLTHIVVVAAWFAGSLALAAWAYRRDALREQND